MMTSRRIAVCALSMVVVVGGCSSKGGDAGDAGGSPDLGGPFVRRYIPDDVLARKAISYSGYRGTQSPDAHSYPREDEIKEDLQLLIRGNWTFLRLFDCSPHAERVLKVIKDDGFDLKVMQGIWIAGAKALHDQENREQIDKCVALAQMYQDIIVAVSVGNENLDAWSDVRVPPAELVAYITDVRGRVSQPVTTDDMFYPFTLAKDTDADYTDVIEVARVVDFLALHVYAFIDADYDGWDWKQLSVPEGPQRAVAMMNAAMTYQKSSIADAAAAMKDKGLDLPIVIGETGWKATPTGLSETPNGKYRAHPVNQKMFYDSVEDWVYGSGKDATSPRAVFYFEAFDEPWKSEDDGWGLFDTDRAAKYVIWSAFPDKKPANAPDYTDNDAVYAK
jgi:exo-beta-1,3-glucanase (GH17 family)